MVDQPEDDAVELSDAELDALIGTDDDTTDTSTGAPAAAVVEPVNDGTSDAAPADNAPAGDVAPEPAVAAQPVPATASAPAAPASGKPFQFKASGRDHSLPWASELPDGSVVIPKEAQAEFRRELASGRELQANFRTLQRESNEKLRVAQTQRTSKDAEADAVIGLMSELLRLTPEQQFQYLAEFQGNVPQLQLDLRKRQLDEKERMLTEQAKGPQLSEEEQQERYAETVQGELAATFTYLEQDDAFKGLTAEDKQTLRTRWEKRPELLVRRATEDMPEHGIAKGDVLFDPSNLLDDAKFLLANRKPAVPSPTAVARNAALNADRQTPVNPIPPSVRNRAPTGQPRDTNGQFTNRKSWRKSILEDDDDEAA